MTVTFYTPASPAGYSVRDWCFTGLSDVVHPTEAEALVVANEHQQTCEECRIEWTRGYIVAEVPPTPEINVANTNARALLDLLGLDAIDLVGDIPADDFLGRVIIALTLAPTDPGVAPTTVSAPGRATIVDCGRDPYYLQNRLEELHTLAAYAATHQLPVRWS